MIVAVTGGGGFIGRHLVQLHLDRGDVVRVLTRDPRRLEGIGGVDVFEGDLGHEGRAITPFLAGVDILYHCAAEIRDPAIMHSVNVEGTERLVHAAAGQVRRWVQLSSVGAYGPVRSGVVEAESPERPEGVYELTKTKADEIVRRAHSHGAFEAVLLRPSNVYGEGMPNQALFQMFAMIERGLFFFIGPKGASANYVHVHDVANALVVCATHPAASGSTYIISNWDTMESLVEGVSMGLGCPLPTKRLPLGPVRLVASALGCFPGFPLTRARVDALSGHARYSNCRIERDLGFHSQVSVREGIAKLSRWWKETSTSRS